MFKACSVMYFYLLKKLAKSLIYTLLDRSVIMSNRYTSAWLYYWQVSFIIVIQIFQTNLTLLEEENATLQQLNIEDNEQILIEGIICLIFVVLII